MASKLGGSCVFVLCLWSVMTSPTCCEGATQNTSRFLSPTMSYPGDIYVGILIDLHRSSVSDPSACGELNPTSVQKLWAAIWALDTLNNQTEADMPKLGLKIYDTCDSPALTLRHTLGLLRASVHDFPDAPSCDAGAPRETPPSELLKMIGVIGVGEAEVLRPALSLSHLYSVPLLLASPSSASELPVQSNVLTTAPIMASLVQAVVNLLGELQVKALSTLSSSSVALQHLTTSVLDKNMAILRSTTITKADLKPETVRLIFPNKPAKTTMTSPSNVVVLMLEPSEMDVLVALLSAPGAPSTEDVVWIVACPLVDRKHLSRWSGVLVNAFLVTPHPLLLHDFRSSFLSALYRRSNHSLAIEGYLQLVYNCTSGSSCAQLSLEELARGFVQDPGVPFVSQAISALAAALRLTQIDSCQLGAGQRATAGAPCSSQQALTPPLFRSTLRSLMRLSLKVEGGEPKEVEGTRLKFNEDGKLVFKHFDIYFFNGSANPVQIGWYSVNVGLNVNVVWRQKPWTTRLYSTFSELEVSETSELDDPSSEDAVASSSSEVTKKSWVSVFRFHHTSSSFVARGWATAVIIFAAIGALMTAYIFVYVLIKICDRTLTGNQFLGILLLLSVMCLYSTCVLFVLPPSEPMCNWRTFFHSFSYALCYGVLFVKVMQLRSLVSLGLGGRLSHLNQAFTLFFMVGLQTALNVQWSVLTRPVFGVILTEEHKKEVEPRCLITSGDFIWSQTYVILLLIMTFAYALYTRNIRRNHNEGRWVLLASGLSIPIWITWIAVFMMVPVNYQEAAVCAGLILSATVVVCAVFFPKIHTLNARHKAAVKRKELSSTTSTATVFSLSQDLMDSSPVGVKGNGQGQHKAPSANAVPNTYFSSNSLLRNSAYDVKAKRGRGIGLSSEAKDSK